MWAANAYPSGCNDQFPAPSGLTVMNGIYLFHCGFCIFKYSVVHAWYLPLQIQVATGSNPDYIIYWLYNLGQII